ncbi:MAG: [ribosomal protein S5]-alanine N-acetyltransferase, partial [Actinomycetota bacterium]
MPTHSAASDGRPRYNVRPPEPQDRARIVALGDDERLFTHMMIRFSRAEMDSWFTAWLDELREPGRSFWPLVITAGTDAVGFAMITQPLDQVAELQWYVSPEHWRKGCATAATQRSLPLIFDELGCHRVYATADPDNLASIKTLERAGFRLEGHHVDYVLT